MLIPLATILRSRGTSSSLEGVCLCAQLDFEMTATYIPIAWISAVRPVHVLYNLPVGVAS